MKFRGGWRNLKDCLRIAEGEGFARHPRNRRKCNANLKDSLLARNYLGNGEARILIGKHLIDTSNKSFRIGSVGRRMILGVSGRALNPWLFRLYSVYLRR